MITFFFARAFAALRTSRGLNGYKRHSESFTNTLFWILDHIISLFWIPILEKDLAHYALHQHDSSYLMLRYRSCKLENRWKENKDNCSHYGVGVHGHIWTEDNVLCSITMSHVIPFFCLSLPLFVVFIGHHG